MKHFLHYISLCYVLLSLIACKKQDQFTADEVINNNSFNIKTYTVSKELLAKELHNIKIDSSNIHLKNKDSVLAFYQLRQGKPAWTNSKSRLALFNNINNSHKEGLNPTDYNIEELEKIIANISVKYPNNVFIDLFLTDTYLTYVYHLANGKLKPQHLYQDWRLTPNRFQFNTMLSLALDQHKLTSTIQNYKPQHKIYSQLIHELQHAKSQIYDDSLRTKVSHGRKIRPNMTNDRVKSVRKRLHELGFLNDSLVNNSPVLDSLLQKQLKHFQLEHNLQVDAIIGESTVKALNKSNYNKYLSILANLERWRWFPRQFGSPAIVVNIPQYQLTYTSDTEEFSHNIVVGKTTRQTPVFSSAVRHIDFNPLWYIPPTIKKEDVIPSASKNIDYLRKKNISVYDKQGKQLVLDSINWNTRAPYGYSYIQASGNSNALGRLKIIFPNNFSVYLHDTPSKSLFNKNYRAKSSGCVRVQNVFKLASRILEWPEDKITETINLEATKRVLPQTKTKVHFLYWSVVFDDNFKPKYLNDVYQLDQELGQLLAH
ncbi:MAG: L,D-transpeptidase family protein [Flavobacteriaceae bacterium]